MKKILSFIIMACIAMSVAAQKQTLLVLNKDDNTLTFIDPVTMKAGETIKTGEGPHEIAVSDDGKTAFVANYGAQKPGNTLSIIDLAAKKEVKVVDLGPFLRPHGLVFFKGKLYITAELNRVVYRYDPAKDKIDWVNGLGSSIPHMVAVTPDGKRVYTANIYSNSVTMSTVGGPPTPEYIKQIDVGPKPEAIEITPDGNEIWVGQNEDGKISIINASTNKVDQVIAIGEMPIRIKFTPDGKLAIVSDHPKNELVVVDTKTRAIVNRIKAEGGPVGIVISNDGKYLYAALTGERAVIKIDLSNFKEIGRVTTGNNPDGIALSYTAN